MSDTYAHPKEKGDKLAWLVLVCIVGFLVSTPFSKKKER